jgi:phosphoribosylanthranilate isomerase
MWIKICGMTGEESVAASLAACVDAIGFVFAPSVRQLSVERALELAAPARGRVTLVAVALHPSQSLIDQVMNVLRPDALQTDLSDFQTLRLPESVGWLPVVRALTAKPPALPRRFLFEGARSGSGELSDWSAAATLARSHELILAGGLNANNIATAIGAVQPFGVDVSSGVETAPGRKSADKIAQFVAAARTALA